MANKQMKNAQHHIVKKIQNICDETNIYHNGHSKNTIKKANKDVQHPYIYHIIYVQHAITALGGKQYWTSSLVKTELPLTTATPLLDIYSKELIAMSQRDICTFMFIVASSTSPKGKNNPTVHKSMGVKA